MLTKWPSLLIHSIHLVGTPHMLYVKGNVNKKKFTVMAVAGPLVRR
jgi:hypothetical protein